MIFIKEHLLASTVCESKLYRPTILKCRKLADISYRHGYLDTILNYEISGGSLGATSQNGC